MSEFLTDDGVEGLIPPPAREKLYLVARMNGDKIDIETVNAASFDPSKAHRDATVVAHKGPLRRSEVTVVRRQITFGNILDNTKASRERITRCFKSIEVGGL